ncbi:MAG TPA: BON domain-containing protein [Deinococcales bacterium]|nr:BON domain-containing protein [Deinococcales bacterium]
MPRDYYRFDPESDWDSDEDRSEEYRHYLSEHPGRRFSRHHQGHEFAHGAGPDELPYRHRRKARIRKRSIQEERARNRAYGPGRYSADPYGTFHYYADYYNDEFAGEDFSGLGPKGYGRSDERIHEDVCELLTWDPAVDPRALKVEVEDGIVTLSGSVRNRHMKRRAEDLADQVAGVTDVDNRLDLNHRPEEQER